MHCSSLPACCISSLINSFTDFAAALPEDLAEDQVALNKMSITGLWGGLDVREREMA